MIFKPDCQCGHMWWAHKTWGECSFRSCGCTIYRPKPRRRWFTHKPPAGVEPNPPERLPLPGSAPGHPHDTDLPRPHDAGVPVPPRRCFDFRAAGWDCGCLIVRHYPNGKQHQDLCERHKFAAEWNQRLHQ